MSGFCRLPLLHMRALAVFISLLFCMPALQADSPTKLQPLNEAEADEMVREELMQKWQAEQALQEKMDAQVVITSHQITNGSRTIIYEEILPPAPTFPTPAVDSPESAALLSVDQAALPLQHHTLFLSAWIAGDSGLTRLQWSHDGQEYQAWSNVDFRVFQSHNNFTGADAVAYFILMSIEHVDLRALLARGQAPSLQRLANADEALYMIKAKNSPIPEAALHPIEALHEYYASHRAELEIRLQRAQALQAARERQENPAPETSKPLRIQFFQP